MENEEVKHLKYITDIFKTYFLFLFWKGILIVKLTVKKKKKEVGRIIRKWDFSAWTKFFI